MLPIRATRLVLLCRHNSPAPFTGNKEGSMGLMVLRVRPTGIRFPNNITYDICIHCCKCRLPVRWGPYGGYAIQVFLIGSYLKLISTAGGEQRFIPSTQWIFRPTSRADTSTRRSTLIHREKERCCRPPCSLNRQVDIGRTRGCILQPGLAIHSSHCHSNVPVISA